MMAINNMTADKLIAYEFTMVNGGSRNFEYEEVQHSDLYAKGDIVEVRYSDSSEVTAKIKKIKRDKETGEYRYKLHFTNFAVMFFASWYGAWYPEGYIVKKTH